MFSHIMLGASDIERARAFYDALLGVIGAGQGVRNVASTGHVRYVYRHDGSTFMITEPIDDQPASCANGMTLGFRCTSPEQMQQFHDTAVANGATPIEEAPGQRPSGLWLAYVRDPDGHKLCAVHRG